MRAYLISVALLCWPHLSQADHSWTQFRGNDGNGIATATSAPTEWDIADARWKTAIPGVGWSSPVFADGMIWMTTAEVQSLTSEEVERIRMEEYADHMLRDHLVIVGKVTFSAVGVDADSGALVHELELITNDRPAPVHPLNSYASPTPILANGRLYCHFGSFGTVCLDTATQTEIWRARIPHTESVGPGSSPALHGTVLIIPCDGTDDQFVVGLDANTGKQLWRTERPKMEGEEPEYHKAFSTPIIIDHDGRAQAVVVGAQWVCSYDPATGQELWRIRHGDGFSMSPRPLYGNGLVYICTAYNGAGMLALDPSGSGDVTRTHIKWDYEQQVPAMSSPILVGSNVYFVSDKGIATCLDAQSGERLWRERLGGNYCASPILVGDKLYFGSREGQMHVVAASTEFSSVGVSEFDESIMASPAVLEGDLLVRTEGHLYRIAK